MRGLRTLKPLASRTSAQPIPRGSRGWTSAFMAGTGGPNWIQLGSQLGILYQHIWSDIPPINSLDVSKSWVPGYPISLLVSQHVQYIPNCGQKFYDSGSPTILHPYLGLNPDISWFFHEFDGYIMLHHVTSPFLIVFVAASITIYHHLSITMNVFAWLPSGKLTVGPWKSPIFNGN
jgi:hypothetical protein